MSGHGEAAGGWAPAPVVFATAAARPDSGGEEEPRGAVYETFA
jgi:hypothetical protein